MNILFLTLSRVKSINEKGIYSDMLRRFSLMGHNVFVVCPTEKRENENSSIYCEDNITILKIKTGNIQKVDNMLKKGLTTLMIPSQYIVGIKKHLSNIKFDMVIYATPPITFYKIVRYIKKRDKAISYLMLKDIFPQNSIDLGILNKNGIKGLVYKYFRKKEKQLYKISDIIGCMSPENIRYVLSENKEIPDTKMELCPNSIEIEDYRLSIEERLFLREKYDIPTDKKVFVYGGNLGKPQGIEYMIRCLEKCKAEKCFFLIVGDGTEYYKIEKYILEKKPKNVKLMERLPREVYDKMIAACDVGMIFLDHRFTIPNYPSRLLSYMQARLPVLACTDCCTDVSDYIVENEFGWYCESNDEKNFEKCINSILSMDDNCLRIMGEKAYVCLNADFSVIDLCKKIEAYKTYRDG